MNRKILLVEPNYKNKFPPVALMKLSTYYKSKGDCVVFYKGYIKAFIINQITEQCIAKLNSVQPDYDWKIKHDVIFNYIHTRKSMYIEALNLETFECAQILTNWVKYYKDYYWKKTYEKEPEWDRICVTTLFTFYFDITVRTINELKPLAKSTKDIMVGGVLATLQSEEIEKATGIVPHKGLLITPGELDEGDTQIIDQLPLDYTILEETDYKYDMSNAYYAYLTRGCIRHCSFCAVSKLEPHYQDYIPLQDRIKEVEDICGPQKNLLLMDNNVLASKAFDKIIEEIIACGFQAGATYTEPDLLKLSIDNLIKGRNDRGYIRKTQRLMCDYLQSIKDKELSYKVYCAMENNHVLKYETSTKKALLQAYSEFKEDYENRNVPFKRPRQRTVDFNQGVDARLFTPHIAKQLSRIAISPLRIAFDSMSVKEPYLNAIRMCASNGLRNFSNYLLYNFKDEPIDLYRRMRINVELCEDLNVNIYSFPMKYHPLYGEHSHDRNYIGVHWNKKYIRAVQAVLNSTKGMIGRGLSYFYKAFGNTEEEFYTLLEMPDTYIIYRFFFEWLDAKGHPLSMRKWREAISELNAEEQSLLFSIIHAENFTQPDSSADYGERVNYALSFYKNYRDDISESDGSLYSLKKEFDSIPKAELNYIKTSGNGIIVRHNGFQITNEKS